MEGMAIRQPEVDSVCKPKSVSRPTPASKTRPSARIRGATPGYAFFKYCPLAVDLFDAF